MFPISVFNKAGRFRTSALKKLRRASCRRLLGVRQLVGALVFVNNTHTKAVTSYRTPKWRPNLLRFFSFNDEFTLHTEKTGDAAGANVSELRVALIRDDTLERRVSPIDDQMNRRHRLSRVAE